MLCIAVIQVATIYVNFYSRYLLYSRSHIDVLSDLIHSLVVFYNLKYRNDEGKYICEPELLISVTAMHSSVKKLAKIGKKLERFFHNKLNANILHH